MTVGFAIAVWDDDISADDVIGAKSTIVVTESQLVQGYRDLPGSTIVNLHVVFTKQ